MLAKIIDGKSIAMQVKKSIADKVKIIKKTYKEKTPSLTVVLIGENSASQSYVNSKRKACDLVGFKSHVQTFPATIKQNELITFIEQLNKSSDVNGILIQLPLPDHLNKNQILETICIEKDVDGFHPYNLGRLCQRKPKLKPCTPKGITHLLQSTNMPLRGKDAIVVGASEIVGRPMAMELLILGCTVTIAHRFTENLSEKVANADIVIVAVGKIELVKGDWIKQGAIVIDVGINKLVNGKLVGDVEFKQAQKKAAWITPVPGGVGPMTVASLLENTLEAFMEQNNISL